MYFSERRKQGLASLRPGYFSGGGIDLVPMLLGNAINWGAPKLLDYATKTKEQRDAEKYEKWMRDYGYLPKELQGGDEKKDDNNKGTTKSSGWKGFGGGLMNLLATAMLGPLMGPLALTVGKGIMNKSKGLGFTGGDGRSGIGPKVGPKTDYYTGSDEEDKDIENQITKDFSGIDSGGWDPGVTVTTTSAPSHIGPTGPDIHGGNETTTDTTTDTTTSDSGWADDGYWAEGGRVSYSKGGIASLWQR